MKRTLLAMFLMAAAVGLAAPADADAQAEKPKKRKLTKFDFSGDDVTGDTVRPDGVDVNVRRFATFKNLIEVRQTFTDKILKDTEDID